MMNIRVLHKVTLWPLYFQ